MFTFMFITPYLPHGLFSTDNRQYPTPKDDSRQKYPNSTGGDASSQKMHGYSSSTTFREATVRQKTPSTSRRPSVTDKKKDNPYQPKKTKNQNSYPSLEKENKKHNLELDSKYQPESISKKYNPENDSQYQTDLVSTKNKLQTDTENKVGPDNVNNENIVKSISAKFRSEKDTKYKTELVNTKNNQEISTEKKLGLFSSKRNPDTYSKYKTELLSAKDNQETDSKYKPELIEAKPNLKSDLKSSGESVMAAGSDVVTDGEDKQTRWQHLHTDCPDVLTLMLTGQWIPRTMTSAEKRDIEKFYTDVWGMQSLPLNLQRTDKKCGNVTFPKPGQKWRAMCDPNGPTPCCYQYVCTNATLQQCTCTNCTDMRILIHAEYATWQAREPRCQPVMMSVKDICQLLDGYTLAFVGDSLMRHFYITVLMLIRGDTEFGALRPSASQELKRQCHGMYMYPNHWQCTGHVDSKATACGGKVKATFIHYYYPDGDMSPSMMVEEVMELQKLKKIFTVVGFGSHYKLNAGLAEKESLLPLLKNLSTTQSIKTSKVLWTDMHAPSVLKSPIYAKQAAAFVQRYNKEIKKVLRQYDVPSFETYNLTSYPLMTFDGSHYGLGVNRMKAIILLNYILELRTKGLW